MIENQVLHFRHRMFYNSTLPHVCDRIITSRHQNPTLKPIFVVYGISAFSGYQKFEDRPSITGVRDQNVRLSVFFQKKMHPPVNRPLNQIQTVIYHPEVSNKALLSVLDSQMTPFWGHVTPDPDRDLPSRGVPKRGPQKCYAFWGPRFGTRFAQILTQFASKHGPRSKIHFLDPCHTISRVRFTI